MDKAKDFEKFLTEMMSTEVTDIQSPHSSLVYAAREKVLARKKLAVSNQDSWKDVLIFSGWILNFIT